MSVRKRRLKAIKRREWVREYLERLRKEGRIAPEAVEAYLLGRRRG